MNIRDYTYAVITRVPDPELPADQQGGLSPSGNLAHMPDLYVEPPEESGSEAALRRCDPSTERGELLMAPVFVRGEILVLNEWGREISGDGRSPSKWHVEYETFTDIEGAIRLAETLR